jgi:serine/threonine-protein kinase
MPFALTERWDDVRSLFEAAVEQPASGRMDWLVAHCADVDLRAEVAALLACHDRPHSLLDANGGLAGSIENSLPTGHHVGAYVVERLLGRGGMGAVYLAHRADASFDRQVAIKVIGRSLDSADALRRFLSERQTLAGLDHPNIARLLDGGATPDHLPYFVMEYVPGEPIDRFCRDRGLSLDERLTLFLRVAAAVQHAHEHLIVHRDLKPDNVLVRDDGEPKLLDFGIAKTIEGAGAHLTTMNARALTPRYASPEQVMGAAIGTPSDIYSLGVLLYELLTGQSPHGGATASGWQVAREVTEIVPVAPSVAARTSRLETAWAHRLSGDLDAILLMALRKEPERRYRSVDQFAEDIRRFQSGRPVVARPDTAGYRLRKLAARNRWATVAAATAVLALIAGVVVSSWQASEARRSAVRAQAETARAQRVSEFLKTVITLPDPSWNAAGAGGRTDMTVLELLKKAGDRIDRELAADPETAADLHHAIGNTYRARGLFADARVHFARALELRQQTLPANDPKIADSLFYFGANEIWLGHLDVAEQYFTRAIAIERTLPFAQAEQLPYMLLDVGVLPSYGKDSARTEAAINEAHDLFVQHFGPDHMTVAFALQRLGILQTQRGNTAAAKQLFREALRIFGTQSASALDLANVQEPLATALLQDGDHLGAIQLFRRVVAARLDAFGPDHPATEAARNQLASALFSAKEYAEAARVSDDVVSSFRVRQQTSGPQFAFALVTKALCLEAMRAPGGAVDIDEAIRVIDQFAAQERCSAGSARRGVADWYRQAHRQRDAVRMFARAIEDAQAACSPDSIAYRDILAAAPTYR